MNYTKEFIETLEKAEKENLYVGSGNPNASILIIGQELAIDRDKNPEQVTEEIHLNVTKWKENVAKKLSQIDELEWENPLYLYKGCSKKEGETWNKYQKLIDLIRNVDHTKDINFQEFAFLTEYNQNPSKSNAQQEDHLRRASITKRDEFFSTTTFFQHFPIVIVAAGDYGGYKFGVDLQKTFNAKYEGYNRGGARQWYSLHFSPDKLVIHTRQLSSNVSDQLLEEIAGQVRDFIKEKGIKL